VLLADFLTGKNEEAKNTGEKKKRRRNRKIKKKKRRRLFNLKKSASIKWKIDTRADVSHH